LVERKTLGSAYGRASFAVLLFQDLAVIPLLALVPLLAMQELSIKADIGFALLESLLILGLIVLIGRYFLHPILHRVALSGNSEVFTASAVLIVLGTAVATEHIGLSMAMGAFLAGLLISDSSYRHQVIAEVQPFRGLLLGLFFMSMGMSLNLSVLLENPIMSFVVVALLMTMKLVVLYLLAYLFGLKTRNGLAVALVLAQSGEFALVLFSLAYQANLLTEDLFQQLLLVVLLSMLATPALAYFAYRLAKAQHAKRSKDADVPDAAPIVVAGFGRVGHRIGEILSLAKMPFVALDYDASIVEKERENGYPVFFGDVCKPELLKAAGASSAKVIIVTLNNPDTTEKVVSTLRELYPKIDIFVRGHSLDECRELRRLGASGAVSENVEASLELARMALTNIRFDRKKRESILRGFRRRYHAQIDDGIGPKDMLDS
ncbi:MAG TPA: potassium transporter KefC, partial [Desulfobacterales bacterium]|nr:potassium transporter KefC [Desulfobacterales bacterium]